MMVFLCFGKSREYLIKCLASILSLASHNNKNKQAVVAFASTVKPVYNSHPWDLKKWPFEKGS